MAVHRTVASEASGVEDPHATARALAPAKQPLGKRLRRLRERALAIGGTSGAIWGLVAGLLLVLFAMWLDLLWELSPQLRVTSSWLALGGLVVVFAALVWFARRWATAPVLARRLDQAGGSGGEIRSGYDLTLARRHSSVLSEGMAIMAVRRAVQLAQDVSSRQVVSARPLRRSVAAIVVLALIVASFILLTPRLAETQWLRFREPYADHPPYSRVQLKVETGNVSVVYGEGLDVYAVAEGPAVDGAELVLLDEESAGEESLPMFLEPSGRWRAALARVTQPSTYFVRSGRARSHKFRIDVITVPRLESVRFRVTPPEYTQQGAYEGPLPQGGLAGLAGTKVEVWAKSNRPLSAGRLTIEIGEAQEPLEMTPVSPGSDEVACGFTIREPGKFRLHVVDTAQQSSLDSLGGTITVLSDQRPFVRLLEPRALSLATPNVALPVVLAAEDDYGISRLQLFRSLNRSRDLPADVAIEGKPRRSGERVFLSLADYGLEPGDEIKLFARVEDNDPARAKGSESSIATVRIISQEEFERMQRARLGLQVLMSKYREAERRLASLREEEDRLRKKHKDVEKDEKASQSARDDLKALSDRLRDEAEAIRKLAKNELPYDLDKALRKQLERMARRLERSAKKASDLASKPKLSSKEMAEALKQMLGDLQDEQRDFGEQVMKPMEYLEQVFPVIEDQGRFIELVRRQRALADRMRSLRGRDQEDDPALKGRMRDLEEEQQKIREALASLLDDLSDHIAQLPEDPELEELKTSALEFVDAVRGSGALEAMAEAELALTEFSGTKAHDKAQEAAEILERFIKKCAGMAGMGGGLCRLRFQPAIGEGLGNTIEQLLAGAGLLPGMGRGMVGSGSGGYSVRRDSLQNVGLYGSHPFASQPSSAGGSRQADAAGGASFSRVVDGRKDSLVDPVGSLEGAGGAGPAVPVHYRRRVGEYFRRIADELGAEP